MNKNNFISYLAVVVFSVVFLFVGSKICKPDLSYVATSDEEFAFAKVLSVGEATYDDTDEYMQNKQIPLKVKITGGKYKDQIIDTVQNLNSFINPKVKEVKPGDKVLMVLSYQLDSEVKEWAFGGKSKVAGLVFLCVLFFLGIIFIGKLKGVTTIFSLIITVLAVFLVYIPSILKGMNIYLSTSIISLFVVFVSLFIINGKNKKTLCAIIGNAGGLFLSGLLAILMSKILNFTGLVDQDYVYLMLLSPEHPIDLCGVLWGGVVIGSLGAIMDVSMSIASAMNELSEKMKDKSFSNMLVSGMNIGKDAIGTMTNTLILAYIGSSLAMVLLFVAYNKSFWELINTEIIAVEIVQAIVGSMGILFAVPATAFVSAFVYNRKTKDSKSVD